MRDPDETDRTLGDLARLGTIASVDLAAALVTVKAGDLVTGPVPWLALHAGARLRVWSPPSVGEQVLLIAPEGEISAAVAVLGIYSTAHPAPAADAADGLYFADGTVFRYNSQAKLAELIMASGGTLHINADSIALVAPNGVSITADLDVIGAITATGDITGNGTSLHGHKHIAVKTGTDQSGVPA